MKVNQEQQSDRKDEHQNLRSLFGVAVQAVNQHHQPKDNGGVDGADHLQANYGQIVLAEADETGANI